MMLNTHGACIPHREKGILPQPWEHDSGWEPGAAEGCPHLPNPPGRRKIFLGEENHPQIPAGLLGDQGSVGESPAAGIPNIRDPKGQGHLGMDEPHWTQAPGSPDTAAGLGSLGTRIWEWHPKNLSKTPWGILLITANNIWNNIWNNIV